MAGITQLIAPFTQLGTYHLLTYGTLLGTEMYQVCEAAYGEHLKTITVVDC